MVGDGQDLAALRSSFTTNSCLWIIDNTCQASTFAILIAISSQKLHDTSDVQWYDGRNRKQELLIFLLIYLQILDQIKQVHDPPNATYHARAYILQFQLHKYIW